MGEKGEFGVKFVPSNLPHIFDYGDELFLLGARDETVTCIQNCDYQIALNVDGPFTIEFLSGESAFITFKEVPRRTFDDYNDNIGTSTVYARTTSRQQPIISLSNSVLVLDYKRTRVTTTESNR